MGNQRGKNRKLQMRMRMTYSINCYTLSKRCLPESLGFLGGGEWSEVFWGLGCFCFWRLLGVEFFWWGGGGKCQLILREEEGQKAGEAPHRALKRDKKMLCFTCSWLFLRCSVGKRRLLACLPQAAQRVSAQGLQKRSTESYK